MSVPRALFLTVPLIAFVLAGCASGSSGPDSGTVPDSDTPITETTSTDCVELSDGKLEDSLPEFISSVPAPDCIYSMQGGYTVLYLGETNISDVTSALTADRWTDIGDATFQKSEKTLAQVFTDKEATGTAVDIFEPPYVVLSAYSLD